MSSSDDFSDVIGTVFNNWTGLKLILEHGTGGAPAEMKRKVENLIGSVHSLLGDGCDRYDLIDELETVLDEEFSTIVEDNSCEEVSDELANLYRLWTGGDAESVTSRLASFKVRESIMVPLSRIGARNLPRVAETEEMSEDPQQNESAEMDEDSEWTVVNRKKK